MIANTKSTLDAKKLCYEVGQILTQSFQKKVSEEQKRLSEVLTSEIPFEDIIGKGEGFKVDKALVALFANEKLVISNGLIAGMSQAIDSFINEEMAGRSLSTLKTTFL